MLDKCAAFEKKVEQQQATITQLRGLLDHEGRGHFSAARDSALEDLLNLLPVAKTSK